MHYLIKNKHITSTNLDAYLSVKLGNANTQILIAGRYLESKLRDILQTVQYPHWFCFLLLCTHILRNKHPAVSILGT